MFTPPEEFDDYVIVRALGRGTTGEVYLAEDAVLSRPVAIKFISGIEPDLASRQRFLMEARTAARIQHPNVVAVYRVGELEGRPYIVSELVRGSSLAEVPPMPWSAALDLAIELARGLAAAHRRGVVHSDIKPGNAMVTEDGVAKLVDFGLARVVQEGAGTDDTAPSLVGTPDYMAPEVWAGRAPSRRSDVYSFGALLFELVAGTPPHGDLDARQLATAGAAPDLKERVPEVDARLARLVARCLERDPELRYPSGEELREALELLHPSRTQLAGARDQNPYRGLRPFESAQRGLFFGRGLEVSALVERLRTDPVVVVTGDSGVGKSSLCRAGVIPAILDGALGAGRAWEPLTLIPGRRPLLALATALGDPTMVSRLLADPEALPRELHRRAGEHGLVLFVDQMEELVTVGDPEEVAAIDVGLARISEGMAGVRLITTLRADFLSRMAALPRLGRELSRLLFFVAPLPPERLRDVITGPAAATGTTFESEAMITTLVEATAQAGGGGLPLLSFALAELWEARDRDRGMITEAALTTMGGVAGALARHGDAVLASMVAETRVQARRVLLRLVTSLGTRVRRTEAELTVNDGTRAALAALVAGRLLVVHDGEDGATYELAHEVLVRGWGTLRGWLDADAEDRARRERLTVAATEWTRVGRRPDATYQGPQLLEARALDATNLTPLERDFVTASNRATRVRTWRRRAAIIGVMLLLVTIVVVQRRIAASQLASDVESEIDAARVLLTSARSAADQQSQLGRAALTRFDADDVEAGEVLWRQVEAERTAADAAFAAAGGRLETALAKDPTRADVRALLADVLGERAELADRVHDVERRDELIGRLAAYDTDGSRRAQWNQPAVLRVDAPPGTVLQLAPPPLATQPGSTNFVVKPGSYLLTAVRPGHEPVRMPVLARRGMTRVLVTLPRIGAIPANFVYIPAGSFLTGSGADTEIRHDFMQAPPLHERTTGAFLISRTEVTIGEYLTFVAAQPVALQPSLLPAIPSKITGGLSIVRDGDGWRLDMRPRELGYVGRWGEPLYYPGRTEHVRQDWQKLPITAITALQAERYAAWMAATGRVPGARLCHELEWERAARGADGRSYPGGDQLDTTAANIDVTHSFELGGLDEVGLHSQVPSPFGLLDMSGNAYELTRSAAGYVGRGGSYYYDRPTAHLANRTAMAADLRDASLGTRLCADAPAVR